MKNSIKHILIVLLVNMLLSNTIKAQQVPYYNFNLINPVVLNPAFTGLSGNINTYLTRGQRYSGFGTGAINNMLSIEGDFFVPNSGFGLLVKQESIGIMSQLGASLSYSYHIKLAEKHLLSLGVGGGYLDNRIRTSDINVFQPDDPFLIDLLPNRTTYDFSTGITYVWKNLKIGFAIPQVIGNKVKFTKSNARGFYSLARHYMLSASYELHFKSAPKLVLTPNAITRFVDRAPLQYDISAKLDYQNIGWFSTTYKSDYAVQFNIGFHIKKNLHIGYSYEYIFGSLKNYFKGFNHEFLLGYTFGNKERIVKEVQVVKNRVPDASLKDENQKLKNAKEDLKRKLDILLQKNKELQDSLDARRGNVPVSPTPKKDTVEVNSKSELHKGSSYYFINIDGSDAPTGYYVVVGVYSMMKNLHFALNDAKNYFPNSYYIINKVNGFKYVVVYYSKKESKRVNETLIKYNKLSKKKVWIINYNAD